MKLGINLWPQNTTWERLRETALLVDRLEFDSLWVWDHFYAISGDTHRPNFEGWQLQAAYAAITRNVRIGCLVAGITHRNPAVLANMATTLDNISSGRAILGIGAAWNAQEQNAYGIDLGTAGERSTRFAEAARIIRRLVDGERVTYAGRYYDMTNAEVLVRPVQERLPIMIGGGGERRTMRTAARYADMWHGFGPVAQMQHKVEVLRQHCAEVGRDAGQVEPWAGRWVTLRDDHAEATRWLERVQRHHGQASPQDALIGSADEVAEKIAAYARVGIRGFVVGFAEPFDTETIERLATEVRPRLGELVAA